jgi:hypothetical protein
MLSKDQLEDLKVAKARVSLWFHKTLDSQTSMLQSSADQHAALSPQLNKHNIIGLQNIYGNCNK